MRADPPAALARARDAIEVPAGTTRGWPAVRGALAALLFGVVLWLLWRYAQRVDADAVLAALRAYPLPTLAAAAACAAASHATVWSYELIGRREVGHRLSTGKVAAVAFVVYAFNLCLGSWVGAVAMRYRLYSRFGLAAATITRVLALSVVTNWVGFLLLAGTLFLLRPPELPATWVVGSAGLRFVGAVFLGLAFAYLALCFGAERRYWTLRGHGFTLPSGRVALLQFGLACTNWLLIAALLWLLLGKRVDVLLVLSVLSIAALAGVISHVPAGLGVIEAVFVALLSPPVPEPQLLAALLGYRALYYFAPLSAAVCVYLVLEVQARRAAMSNTPWVKTIGRDRR